MTRILLVATDLALGGTPRSVESLVLGLDRSRFEVEVVTLLAPSPITRSLEAAGIRCRSLDLRSKLDLARLAPLVSLVRTGRFDLVHTWLFHANAVGRFLRLFARFGLIASERGVETTKSWARVLFDRCTHRGSDLVVVNARAIADVLAQRDRIPAGKIRVIPNGVDLDRFSPAAAPPGGPPRLVCVARLDPIKAHEDLLAVVAALGRRFPGLELDLVGEGPMRPAIEAEVARLGLGSSVHLLGARTDVPDLLRRAHAFVLTSRSEGMPGSVLEAMATGLPVVATSVGGVPEIVEHGRTGLLVPAGDREALEEALAAVLSAPGRALELGRAGLERVHARFTRAAFIRAHESLYEEVTGAGRPSGLDAAYS